MAAYTKQNLGEVSAAGNWTNCGTSMQLTGYHLAIKRNGLLMHRTTWMYFKCTMIMKEAKSKMSQ